MTKKLLLTLIFCLVLGAFRLYTGQAQEEPKYVGSEVCFICHSDTSKTWTHSVHRRTLFNKDPDKNGCESCHGPGGAHVEGGGDINKVIRPQQLAPSKMADICLKCHTGEHVTLWQTSAHARAKVSCIKCHDVHSSGEKSLLGDVENAKLAVEGLTRAIKQTDMASNTAPAGSEEKLAANKKVKELLAELDAAKKQLKGAETAYRRTAEPYVCYDCHKSQEVQSKMPSHHPIMEGKVKCSDCHNPHGGPNGMLEQETVNETCYKCHADKGGPFTFEHPPVTEDCTSCHRPHGSVNNNLLAQSQPFLCLRCHPGPHSRSGTLGNPVEVARYYTECTDCHNQIHGSDTRFSFRH